ncbi:MAG: VOC family protein [Alphaproteobacteria bacterium]|nr:VOC family protein [Alphaproteobacteria bacterium]
MNKITPCLWFHADGEAAARFYVDLFANSKMITPETPTPQGAPPPVMVVAEIAGQQMQFLNGGPHYTLSPAFSLSVNCVDQDEVDHYWAALLADGGREDMCGWLTDRFGVSWQIVPRRLIELMGDPDHAKAQRVTEAMLKMRKLIVADLEAAAKG